MMLTASQNSSAPRPDRLSLKEKHRRLRAQRLEEESRAERAKAEAAEREAQRRSLEEREAIAESGGGILFLDDADLAGIIPEVDSHPVEDAALSDRPAGSKALGQQPPAPPPSAPPSAPEEEPEE